MRGNGSEPNGLRAIAERVHFLTNRLARALKARLGKGVIFVGDNHVGLKELAAAFHGPVAMALHGLQTPPFWLAMGGVGL